MLTHSALSHELRKKVLKDSFSKSISGSAAVIIIIICILSMVLCTHMYWIIYIWASMYGTLNMCIICTCTYVSTVCIHVCAVCFYPSLLIQKNVHL